MTRLREVYKCNVCGNVVEVLHQGATSLVCCGKPMEKLQARTEDQGYEKHLPVVEEKGGNVVVHVGSVSHPMEKSHYIKFIEVLTEDKVYRAELDPEESPAAEFPVAGTDVTGVRAYCNLHGLWSA